MPDGMLEHLRDTYPIETAWAPQHVGDELRQARASARDAHLAALHAVAEAGAEFRRRHPAQPLPPLRSAEPDPATQAQRGELTLTPEEQSQQLSQWISDLAAQHRAFAEKLAERKVPMTLAEDRDREDPGMSLTPWNSAGKAAILQPPKPQIRPSAQMLERAIGHDPDLEAAG